MMRKWMDDDEEEAGEEDEERDNETQKAEVENEGGGGWRRRPAAYARAPRGGIDSRTNLESPESSIDPSSWRAKILLWPQPQQHFLYIS